MPRPAWSRAWKRAPWLRLLSGLTSPLSTVVRGVDEWISSLAVSHAKIFPSRGKEPVWRVSAQDSGRSTPASFPRFGLDLSSLKTSPRSGPAGSTESSPTLPRLGSMRSGVVSERPTWERPIDGSGSSSWPTPRGLAGGASVRITHRSKKDLTTVAAHWATPRANERGDYQVSGDGRGRINLTLMGMSKSWATPTTRDWKDSASPSEKVPTNGLLGRQAPRSEITGESTCECPRTLNPLFVEALMGWPEGWSTARIGSVSSATEWFRRMRHWHSVL